MRKALEFKDAAIKSNISWWPMHRCSICSYECGWLFFVYENAEVVYDNGCYCTTYRRKRFSSWDEIAEFYNTQKNDVTIKAMDAFWGFDSMAK